MKRIFLFVAMIALSTLCFAQGKIDGRAVGDAFARYMTAYPKAELQDLYKLAFQDYMGPGHMITDRAAAEQGINGEIASTKVFGGPLYEFTGYEGNYVRVNLSIVADGIIPARLLADCLMLSAEKPLMNPQMWADRWHQMAVFLPKPMVASKEGAKTMRDIEEMLAQGKFAMHHSAKYNEVYRFHYRIVRTDIFKEKILPVLDHAYGLTLQR